MESAKKGYRVMGSFKMTIAAVVCVSSLALAANEMGTLSAKEMASQSEAHVAKMRNSSTRIRKMLDEAQKKKSIQMATCLGNVLAQVDTAVQQGSERSTAVAAAQTRGDSDSAKHEYSVLIVLRQRVEKLDGDANLCAEDMVMPGTQGPVVTHVDSVDIAPGSSVQPLVDPQRYEVENTPPREKVAKANEAVAKMQTTFENAVKKLEDARNSKDVVQLNCTNEKVTQIKGLLRIAEQSGIALKEAVAMIVAVANGQTPPRSAVDTSNDEYLKIVIASNRVTQLGAEAEGCIGALAFRVDEKVALDVEEPDDLPKNDPSKVLPVSPPPVRQPAASPTM